MPHGADMWRAVPARAGLHAADAAVLAGGSQVHSARRRGRSPRSDGFACRRRADRLRLNGAGSRGNGREPRDPGAGPPGASTRSRRERAALARLLPAQTGGKRFPLRQPSGSDPPPELTPELTRRHDSVAVDGDHSPQAGPFSCRPFSLTTAFCACPRPWPAPRPRPGWRARRLNTAPIAPTKRRVFLINFLTCAVVSRVEARVRNRRASANSGPFLGGRCAGIGYQQREAGRAGEMAEILVARDERHRLIEAALRDERVGRASLQPALQH